MIEHTEKQDIGKEPRKIVPHGRKHYVCSLCKENYHLTDEEHQRGVTCCGLPVNKTEEILMSSPEPFGP